MSIEIQLLLRLNQCLLCLQRQKPYLDYQHHGRHIYEPMKADIIFHDHYQKLMIIHFVVLMKYMLS